MILGTERTSLSRTTCRWRSGWEVETVAETWDWELLAGPATITEGPVWDGSGLFYTSIEDNEIRRYDPATGDIVTVYETRVRPTVSPWSRWRALRVRGKGRRVVRYGPDGVKTTLVDRFEGRRLNSPNDSRSIALAASGSPTLAMATTIAIASSTTTRSTASPRPGRGKGHGRSSA